MDPQSERIDPTFRNGSLTAIGVVSGFSLSFLSSWALSSGSWNVVDLIAVLFMGIGIGLQIRALAGLLAVTSLIPHIYNRLVRFFLSGLLVASLGVTLAILGDVSGLGELLGRIRTVPR